MEGWIKLHRKTINHWIFSNPNYFRAWIIMLFTVNYESKKILINGLLIDCERGQSILSLESWVNIFGVSKKQGSWTFQKVRTFFELLEKDGMITKENIIKSTRITICNYDIYQDAQQLDNNLITTKQQLDNNLITTTKERKEGKKERKKEKSIEMIIPSLEEIKNYFKEKGYKEEIAIKMFEYYSVGNWTDSRGNKVKNWKQKAQIQWFKDENKINTKQQSIFIPSPR